MSFSLSHVTTCHYARFVIKRSTLYMSGEKEKRRKGPARGWKQSSDLAKADSSRVTEIVTLFLTSSESNSCSQSLNQTSRAQLPALMTLTPPAHGGDLAVMKDVRNLLIHLGARATTFVIAVEIEPLLCLGTWINLLVQDALQLSPNRLKRW